jgi:3-isopropylmalate dehydrogenase
LLGAVGWPAPGGGPVNMKDGKMAGWSAVIGNRIRLGLYANVRPVKMLPGIRHAISGRKLPVWSPDCVDMVFVRENTEGMYSNMGGIHSSGGQDVLATDVRLITRQASERVIRYAFELCAARDRGAPSDGKKRVTCIVKNNVLDGCRLFEKIFKEIGESYPDIEKELAIVDAFTQWLVTTPERYDVCVTTNMFGDIVTDLASVLQGGMGMAVGCNLGDDHAMFEPIHGSAPPLAGKDEANPMAMLLAAGEMFSWLGRRHSDDALTRAGAAVEQAVAEIVAAGKPLTADLVDSSEAARMSEVSAAVIDKVRAWLRS